MRSILISLTDKCVLSSSCSSCASLGYLNQLEKPVNLDHVIKSIDSSPSTTVVLPCSSRNHKGYDHLMRILKSKNKNIKNIYAYEYWCLLSESEKLQNPEGTGVIFSKWTDIKKINKENTNYFMIDRANSNFPLDELNLERVNAVRFFFRPSGSTLSLSAKSMIEIRKQIYKINPAIFFEFPFGHDVLDVRNPEHLSWNFFKPDFSRKNTQSDEIAISVIIPFINRTAFLEKVLDRLNVQNLSPKLFEVVLVDDGSDHDKVQALNDVLTKYEKMQIILTYIDRNISLTQSFIGNRAGPARNFGASLARGDILVFLDSDILIPQNYLECIMKEHRYSDVVLPKRVYLTEKATDAFLKFETEFDIQKTFEPSWYSYLKDFYVSQDWANQKLPWKYFITYCLSIKKDIFLKSGGFRTNYISFGYEDLDLGYRVIKLTRKLKLLDENVFHLYHFNSGAEYTTNADFRFFQLAMTSRTFIAQNIPLNADYLVDMATLKNLWQKIYFGYYSVWWWVRKWRRSVTSVGSD